MTDKRLRGGSFNLRYGRNPKQVKREIDELMHKHRLHFLCVQEAMDYLDIIRADPELVYVPAELDKNTGIIVRHGVPVDRKSWHTYGDGYVTVRGGKMPASFQPEARLNNWLYVRCVHLPTPTEWQDGRLKSPPERADDYKAGARGLKRFFDWPCILNGRIAVGDWNEPPTTMGELSPRWIANQSHAKISYPTSRLGHGHIDYVLHKGVRVERIWKDTNIVEYSDHEPVIFAVVKGR